LPAYSPDLVVSIYQEELGGAGEAHPVLKRVMLLEVSQYLELYLWPHFDAATANYEHIMSIMLMVNEKFRNGVPAWSCFKAKPVRTFCITHFLPLHTLPAA
jgi:intron-binding protein aquarius